MSACIIHAVSLTNSYLSIVPCFRLHAYTFSSCHCANSSLHIDLTFLICQHLLRDLSQSEHFHFNCSRPAPPISPRSVVADLPVYHLLSLIYLGPTVPSCASLGGGREVEGVLLVFHAIFLRLLFALVFVRISLSNDIVSSFTSSTDS